MRNIEITLIIITLILDSEGSNIFRRRKVEKPANLDEENAQRNLDRHSRSVRNPLPAQKSSTFGGLFSSMKRDSGMEKNGSGKAGCSLGNENIASSSRHPIRVKSAIKPAGVEEEFLEYKTSENGTKLVKISNSRASNKGDKEEFIEYKTSENGELVKIPDPRGDNRARKPTVRFPPVLDTSNYKPLPTKNSVTYRDENNSIVAEINPKEKSIKIYFYNNNYKNPASKPRVIDIQFGIESASPAEKGIYLDSNNNKVAIETKDGIQLYSYDSNGKAKNIKYVSRHSRESVKNFFGSRSNK